MRYLLDTHTWIWWHSAAEKLSPRVKNLISEPERYEELLLSAISPWELSKLLEKRKLRLSCDGETWIQEALEMPFLRLVPLSPRIAWHSTTLPGLFHDDPADQIIVATARIENATIITIDHLIQKYEHVQSLW